MKVTGAFLAEKADAVNGALHVEGGVVARLSEDPGSGNQLVSLVVLVQGDGQGKDEDKTIRLALESLSAEAGQVGGQEWTETVHDSALHHRAGGFSISDLQFSKSDLPVDGWYTLTVTGPGGEKFMIAFYVGTQPAAASP